jgi:hypothetical protein
MKRAKRKTATKAKTKTRQADLADGGYTAQTLASRIVVLEAELDDSVARHRAEVYTHDGLKKQIDTLRAERDEQMARANRAENLIAAYREWFRGQPT